MKTFISLARFGGHGAAGFAVMLLLVALALCGLMAFFSSISNGASDSKKDK